MIISCKNCSKKFDVDKNLIPQIGRLLQCSSCDYKWFFKNEKDVKIIEPLTDKILDLYDTKIPQVNNPIDVDNRSIINTKLNSPTVETIIEEIEIDRTKIKKNNSFLSLTIIFLISFIALIILLDTFKNPLSLVVPNLEFILYNLYESIKDFELFIRDLF